MRNVLILIVSLLAPYALYASGCNQNPQAAFPTTPEMRALARAPGTAGRAPFIPAPAIDREILASAHDASTQSRVQAVQDRSNVYAMAAPAAGLFVLPAEQVGAGAPYAAAPMPSAREFWSRPVVAAAPQSGRQAQPRYASAPDVYAMAPAGQPSPEAIPVLPALGFEPLPEPITIGPAVPTAGFYSQPIPRQRPAQSPQEFPARRPAFVPPAALSAPTAPAGPALPYSLRPGEKLLPPEAVPGLFLGADASGAAALRRQPLAAAGMVRETEPRSGMVRNPPAAPPPLLSLSPPGLPPASSRPLASAPQHRASRRLEALLQNTDAAPALAPLPSVAGNANPIGQTGVAAKTNVTGKTGLPANPVTPAASSLSAQAELPAGLIPPPPAEVKPAVPASDLHDFFRSDFWAAKQSPALSPASAPALRPEGAGEMNKIPVKELGKEPVKELAKESLTARPAAPVFSASAPALPPLPLADAVPAAAKPAAPSLSAASVSPDSALKPPEDFVRDWDWALPAAGAGSTPADIATPTRVTLKPIRKKRDLQAIDSTVDAAPMKF